jgi:hypothetical protein
MPARRQTRSQTTIHTPDIPYRPLPLRVVTPRTLRHSPPRVPTGSLELSPRNLSQDDFCDMDTAHMEIALENNHWSQRHHANAVIHPVTSKEMEYPALLKDPHLQPLWTRGFGNKCGRLFQGIRDIPGTDTCFFIELKNIPADRKITYGKIVYDNKPHKQEKECVWLTVGGDRPAYSGNVATSTADITTFKILINSTLSTKDAAMMMMDIKNDFAVKYVGKHHAEHLRNALLRTYELTNDWTATVYSGMKLKWDYNKRICNMSMPGYLSNVFSKFQHNSPKQPQHTPSWYVTPVYGAKTQYATRDETPPLTAQQCLTIQKVTGSVLYYARAVDPTVVMPVNDIATE